jgi:hypothetical protein
VTLALVLGALVAVIAVLAVARPFLREAVASPEDDRLEEPDEPRLAREEERDRALAALKELEFDHRTGKVSDDDYRELVGPLRRRAAALLDGDSRNEQEVSLPSERMADVPIPEPAPVPHEPPVPPAIPEPTPAPSTPPAPPTIPEPAPVPHEPPPPAA